MLKQTFSIPYGLRNKAIRISPETMFTAKKICSGLFEWGRPYPPTLGPPNVDFGDAAHAVALCLHHQDFGYAAWQVFNSNNRLIAQFQMRLNTLGLKCRYSKYARPERALVRGPVYRARLFIKTKSKMVTQSYRHLIRCPNAYRHQVNRDTTGFTTLRSEFAAKISGGRLAGTIHVSNAARLKMEVMSTGRYALARGIHVRLNKILVLPKHCLANADLRVGAILSGIVISDGVERRWDGRNRGEHRLQARAVTSA